MTLLADLILTYSPVPLSAVPKHLTSWKAGITPLSTTPVVVSVMAAYLTTIFTIQYLMRDKQPYILLTWFRAHNIILSLGSALLLALMLEEIVPIVLQHGLRYAICDTAAWTPRLEFYYMANYYIKYVELIDTVFLALKKKPLAFLHVFHHAATALLCYNQLQGRTPVSWTVIVLNLGVHVIMYYYYYGTAGGRKFWWKRHVTTMQIFQFVIDLFIVYYASAQLFIHRYRPLFPSFVPESADCAGTENAALFGCGLLSSYLILFIHFFFKTYVTKRPTAAGEKDRVMNGTANGHYTK